MFDAQSSNSLKMKQEHLNILNICSTAAFAEVDSVDDADEEQAEQIKIPYDKGIAGHVAATAQALNIPNAYLDARFNPTIDKITGYITRSILCLPILDENGQCIAVAEAINKSNDYYGDEIIDIDEHLEDLSSSSPAFNKQDEEVKHFWDFVYFEKENVNKLFFVD